MHKSILFILMGMAAGATSLFVSVFLIDDFLSDNGIWEILSLVIIEETIKCLLLYFNRKIFLINQLVANLILASIFGFGFALFETLMIFLSTSSMGWSIVFIFLIHAVSSIFLSLGIIPKDEKTSLWKTFYFFLLAIIIHLCYNLLVMKFTSA